MENKKAWIYIHIPKTAGTFIKSRIKESIKTSKILDPFSNNSTFSIPLRNAPSIKFVREQIKNSNDDRVGFVIIVRNPFDRIYSMWKWSRIYGEIGNLDFPDVEDNFEDYLMSLSLGKYDTCYFMQKQTFFFTGGEDRYVETMKFEELNTTVKTFFENNGVIWSNEKINATGGESYKEIYSNKMRDIVVEKYAEEFQKFNYSLDL